MSQARRPDPRAEFVACRSSGKTMRVPAGYILEHSPAHPAANRYGYVMQHRLVMERRLGRYLSGREAVHHVNHNPADNRIENLQLLADQAAHMRLHRETAMSALDRHLPKLRSMAVDRLVTQADAARKLRVSVHRVQAMCRRHEIRWLSAAEAGIDERSAREALRGRTTAEAATRLGVTHMTLRLRFPHLIKKRALPGFLDGRKEEIRSLARTKTLSALGEQFGTSSTTIASSLRRWSKMDGWSDESVFRHRRGPDRHRRARKM